MSTAAVPGFSACSNASKLILEVFGVGRHHGQVRAGSVDIRLVLREVGGKGDDFVSRLGHHAQCVGQRAGRTRGREDVVGRIVHVEAAVEAFRNGRAHRGNAQRRRVSVQRDRFRLLVQGDHFVGEALRAGHARIAQRIVEHVLVADFGTARGRVFAQLADHGFSAEHGLVSFVDHGQPPRRFVHFARSRFSTEPIRGSRYIVSTTGLSQPAFDGHLADGGCCCEIAMRVRILR